MLDVVYILGSGSQWNNNELRYSLRSLEKHFKHGRVFIVGECPDWLQNVVHIEFPDSFLNRDGGKFKNVIRKVRAACNDERISESFVLMNDDFYFLRDCPKIEPYSIGTLQDMITRYEDKTSQYRKALARTMRLLKAHGIENPISYAVHYPIIYEKQKVLQMIGEIDLLENVYSWRTLYGNLFSIGGVEREDPKISSAESFKQFLLKEDFGDFLSTSNNVVLNQNFQDWIEKMFPNKSQYEKPQYEQTRPSRRLR